LEASACAKVDGAERSLGACEVHDVAVYIGSGVGWWVIQDLEADVLAEDITIELVQRTIVRETETSAVEELER
jgi:hypothetical protein